MISSKLSRRYAKALFSLGQEDGNYNKYGKDLQEFSSFCDSNEEFFQVISNPVFSLEDRKKVFEIILGRSVLSQVTKNFLGLLLDKDRIGAIAAISDYYMKYTDEISNVISARVIAAKPLKDEIIEKLKDSLIKLTSKEVKLEVDVDESLIGGLVVTIGDLVLNGSVRAQLEGIKESLKRGEYN
ncbi:MAG: ATP synthase F1 subunit delta [Deltaproteobacteria bacterium]|nr:ATP synthase F1 subunit delta [Deltaproteobacteria bacterium]